MKEGARKLRRIGNIKSIGSELHTVGTATEKARVPA